MNIFIFFISKLLRIVTFHTKNKFLTSKNRIAFTSKCHKSRDLDFKIIDLYFSFLQLLDAIVPRHRRWHFETLPIIVHNGQHNQQRQSSEQSGWQPALAHGRGRMTQWGTLWSRSVIRVIWSLSHNVCVLLNFYCHISFFPFELNVKWWETKTIFPFTFEMFDLVAGSGKFIRLKNWGFFSRAIWAVGNTRRYFYGKNFRYKHVLPQEKTIFEVVYLKVQF